jgi:hypothetical protein
MATAYVEAAKQKGDSAKLVIIEKAAHFELVDPKSSPGRRSRTKSSHA